MNAKKEIEQIKEILRYITAELSVNGGEKWTKFIVDLIDKI